MIKVEFKALISYIVLWTDDPDRWEKDRKKILVCLWALDVGVILVTGYILFLLIGPILSLLLPLLGL